MNSAARRGVLGRDARPWEQPAGRRRVPALCVVIVLTALLMLSAIACSANALAIPIRVTVGSTAVAHAYDTAIPRAAPSAAADNVAGSSPLGSAPSPVHTYDDRSNPALMDVRAGGEGLAPQTVPEALTIGRNAERGVDVYLGVRGGKPVYAGITNSVETRAVQHGARFDQLSQITTQSVTRGEARAIEQALIVRNPGFENAINSISPRHPWYQQAVDWGESWLQGMGL